jgi:hypothetical protein
MKKSTRSSGAQPETQKEKSVVAWDRVTCHDVLRAMHEYGRLGQSSSFLKYGFAPTTTYELVWEERRYPPKAVLGAAYELAMLERFSSKRRRIMLSVRVEEPTSSVVVQVSG